MPPLAKAWELYKEQLSLLKVSESGMEAFRNVFYCGAATVFQTLYQNGKTKAQTEEIFQSFLDEIEVYSTQLETKKTTAQ